MDLFTSVEIMRKKKTKQRDKDNELASGWVGVVSGFCVVASPRKDIIRRTSTRTGPSRVQPNQATEGSCAEPEPHRS